MARDEGWLAEHMLILGVENPQGEKTLRRGRLPERLRQDQLRHADPARRASRAGRSPRSATTSPGSARARTAGCTPSTRRPASSAWRRAPRAKTNPNAMAIDRGQHHLHQRGADPRRRRLVGGHDRRAAGRADRLAGPARGRRTAAARPRTRTRASPRPASQCPSIDPAWENPEGVPISAFIFGGRRATHGAAGVPGVQLELRRLPRAPRSAPRPPPPPPAPSARCAATRWPCCRSAATTWATTSTTGCRWAAQITDPPRIFCVNWFRKDEDGKFIWPGFGENMRVLKWIVDRVRGRAPAHREPARLDAALRGPRLGRAGDFPPETFTRADDGGRASSGRPSCSRHRELFEKLYDRLPKEFMLHARADPLGLASPEQWRLEAEA